MSPTACGRWAGCLVLVGLLGCHRPVDSAAPPAGTVPTATPADPFAGPRAGAERTVAGIKLCWCPAGTFTMGSPRSEPERRPGEDQVEVTLSRGFWTAKYETTQGQWKRIVGKLPGEFTAELPEDDDLPVGNVNFAEAEAGPSLSKSTKVGSYPANPWGLHDLHGNTCEWCRDWYHAKLPGGVDPDLSTAKATAQKNRDGSVPRSRRGGTWVDEGWPNRSAFRQRFEPERRYDHIGFRVVAVQP